MGSVGVKIVVKYFDLKVWFSKFFDEEEWKENLEGGYLRERGKMEENLCYFLKLEGFI